MKIATIKDCPTCKGTGLNKSNEKFCSNCEGTGAKTSLVGTYWLQILGVLGALVVFVWHFAL